METVMFALSPTRDSRRGFTLVELMIVVVIIGVLAAIAIPGFIQYVRNAKTSEAHISLKTIGDGAATYYQVVHYDTATGIPQSSRQFPEPMGSYAVSSVSVPKEGKVVVSSSDWSASPWTSLRFLPAKHFYYQYQYISVESSGSLDDSFTARAVGSGGGVFHLPNLQSTGRRSS